MIDYDLSNDDARVAAGDVVMIEEPQATRQRLEQKFKLWRGEWFLNVNAGFPWLDDVLGQRPRPEVLRSLVHDLVTNDPGVRSMNNLTLAFEGVNRQLRITFDATLTSGVTENMDITL